jgi:uncharacterized membrane protein
MAKQTHRPPAKQPNQLNTGAHNPKLMAQSQHWAGPLPPPDALSHFNDIIENGAERIMTMVEQEQAHRIDHDKTVLVATINDTKRGHWIGGLICVLSIAGAVFTSYIGVHPAVSISLVGLPLATIIQSIIRSKSNS